MKLILDYFYSICGYQEGWCNKRSKCSFIMNMWQVSDKIKSCGYFMQNHPITKENYRQFIGDRKGG